VVGHGYEGGGVVEMADAVFIAANHPGTVLARVAAEREILVEHAVHRCGQQPWDCALEPTVGRSFCNACRAGVLYPCRTVLWLAKAWGWEAET
jgi:hypothetical protein